MPAGELQVMGENGPVKVSTDQLFARKKVVLFAVPGAFTPTCSRAHLPGYVMYAEAIKAKGVDAIVCLSVNDAFVMNAWGNANNAGNLIMAADGSAEYTKKLGMELDATAGGMGIRSKRYAMILEDGAVTQCNLDPGKLDLSRAETILEAL